MNFLPRELGKERCGRLVTYDCGTWGRACCPGSVLLEAGSLLSTEL